MRRKKTTDVREWGVEALVQAAQNRDAEAFTELIQSQMQNMYKTAWAILRNDEDAADAISDTVLACWEKLDQLKQASYFRTWMTRILVNKCNDQLRGRSRMLYTDEMPEIPASDAGYSNLEWNEALLSLDEKYRLVLLLYYAEGYKTSEISAILELPESTVRTRLARGREKLAEEIDGGQSERKTGGYGTGKKNRGTFFSAANSAGNACNELRRDEHDNGSSRRVTCSLIRPEM